MLEKLFQRFKVKFTRSGEYECWEWKAARKGSGYGVMRWGDGKNILAHRASHIFHIGPIPEGLIVRHRCGNPGCVNPKHLLLGTQEDKKRDAKDRDSFVKGELHPSSRLTEDDVKAILASEEHRDILARRYNVSSRYISMIQRGMRWSHFVADNLPEKLRLRRQLGALGQRHHKTHLTPDDIRAIRRDDRVQSEIAADFDVSRQTVSNIKLRKHWRHVPDD